LLKNSIFLEAEWELHSTTSTDNVKNSNLISLLATSTDSPIVVPFNMLQNGSDYTFRATFLEANFDLVLTEIQLYQNVSTKKCDCRDELGFYDHLAYQCSLFDFGPIEIKASNFSNPCSDIQVNLTLTDAEYIFWGEVPVVVSWTITSTYSG